MLHGKSAIITGSTSGIGRSIAEVLAGQGCAIVLNGFGEPDEVEALRLDLAKKNDVMVAYSAADMSRPDEIAGMMAEAEAAFGGVDILVNNAGIQHVAPVEEFPPERWDAIIAINLSAAFHAIRGALPAMKRKRWGRIVNISSVHGLVASTGKAAYVAAEHGIIGLTKVVALEAAGSGVTCNAICPGWVLTPLVEVQIAARAEAGGLSLEDAKQQLLSEKQPSGGFATPEQIGQLALYLCSDAAGQVTGAAFPIDGGWTAQ